MQGTAQWTPPPSSGAAVGSRRPAPGAAAPHPHDAEDFPRSSHGGLDLLHIPRLTGGDEHGGILHGGEQLVTPVRLVQELLHALHDSERGGGQVCDLTPKLVVSHNHSRYHDLKKAHLQARLELDHAAGGGCDGGCYDTGLIGGQTSASGNAGELVSPRKIACVQTMIWSRGERVCVMFAAPLVLLLAALAKHAAC